MKPIRRLSMIALLICCGAVASEAAQPIKVVATLSTFADLAKTVGGEYVEVSSIASPKFNPHFIEPKPSDVLRVKRAQLFIHAGLDLELWRWPLLDAAGNLAVFPGQPGELDLSQGIALLEVPAHTVSRSEGDIHLYGNPHYWTDPENGMIIARTICDKLCAIDPAHAQAYHANLKAWLDRMDARLPAWRAALVPLQGGELVGYHNEWPYVMRFAGLRMSRFLEPKPGIPPTPKQLELLEQYAKDQRVRAIVQSTYFPLQAAQAVAKRAGTKVIELCQNVQEAPQCSDYIAMVDYNVSQLVGALIHD